MLQSQYILSEEQNCSKIAKCI